MTITKPSPNMMQNVQWTFDTVSAMKASTKLVVGDYVKTLGYSYVGDGGGAVYEIVAAATGTDDGGSYHDLTGITGQAKLLHNGIIYGEQFGAVDGVEASAELQAAWYALYNWQQTQPSYTQTWLFHKSNVTIQNQVEFKAVGDGTTDFMNFDLSGSAWVATTGGDLDTSTAVLKVRSTKAVHNFGYIDGNKTVAGIDMFGVVGSRGYSPEVRRCKGYHIRMRGAVGSYMLFAPLITEYQQSDAEFPTDANYTAVGIQVSAEDWKCIGANVMFCGKCIQLGNDPDDATADPAQVHFTDCHIVNGDPVDGAAGPRVDGILVENHATRENHFNNCYFDNGLIEDYKATLHINGGHYVNNGRATLTNPHVRLYASSASQDSAGDLRISGLGGVASVGFLDNGANTWNGTLTDLSGVYSDMEDENKTVNSIQTEYNLYLNETDIIAWNWKLAGDFQRKYTVNGEAINEVYEPATGTYRISNPGSDSKVIVGAGTVGIGEIGGEGGKLELYAGGSNRWHIQSGGNMRPEVDNSYDLGATGKRIAIGYMTQIRPGDGTPIWTSGIGTPEGAVTAVVGSLFTRTDGGASTTLYVKESGTGDTGWVAK